MWEQGLDMSLRDLVLRLGEGDWEAVAASLQEEVANVTPKECKERWSNIEDNPVKGPWSPEEDELLRQLVGTIGAKRWQALAKRFPGRTGKQCRERWHNHVDERVHKGGWELKEDLLLVSLQMKMGNRWSEISKHFGGRSENAIKNRYNSLSAKGFAGTSGPTLRAKHQKKNGATAESTPPAQGQDAKAPSALTGEGAPQARDKAKRETKPAQPEGFPASSQGGCGSPPPPPPPPPPMALRSFWNLLPIHSSEPGVSRVGSGNSDCTPAKRVSKDPESVREEANRESDDDATRSAGTGGRSGGKGVGMCLVGECVGATTEEEEEGTSTMGGGEGCGVGVDKEEEARLGKEVPVGETRELPQASVLFPGGQGSEKDLATRAGSGKRDLGTGERESPGILGAPCVALGTLGTLSPVNAMPGMKGEKKTPSLEKQEQQQNPEMPPPSTITAAPTHGGTGPSNPPPPPHSPSAPTPSLQWKVLEVGGTGGDTGWVGGGGKEGFSVEGAKGGGQGGRGGEGEQARGPFEFGRDGGGRKRDTSLLSGSMRRLEWFVGPGGVERLGLGGVPGPWRAYWRGRDERDSGRAAPALARNRSKRLKTEAA